MKNARTIRLVAVASCIAALAALSMRHPSAQAAVSAKPDTPFKLATFETGGQPRVGLVLGNRIYDAAAASIDLAARMKLPAVTIPSEMRALIEQYEKAAPRLYQIANAYKDGAPANASFAFDVAKVKIDAPIRYPYNLLAIAANYKAHAAGMGQRQAGGGGFNAAVLDQIQPDRDAPIFFAKSPRSCIIGTGEPYYIANGRERTDWEGELAIVMGKPAYMVPRERAHDYVFGYTIMYDVSDRGGGTPRRVVSMFPGTNWFEGKSTDRAAPMGPFIVPKEFLPDAAALHLVTRINGVVKQDAHTSEMIWDEAHQINYLTSILSLYPGDVISTGTPSGTGMERNEFLKPGDEVSIEIEKIGTLRTPIKAQSDRPRSTHE